MIFIFTLSLQAFSCCSARMTFPFLKVRHSGKCEARNIYPESFSIYRLCERRMSEAIFLLSKIASSLHYITLIAMTILDISGRMIFSFFKNVISEPVPILRGLTIYRHCGLDPQSPEPKRPSLFRLNKRRLRISAPLPPQ